MALYEGLLEHELDLAFQHAQRIQQACSGQNIARPQSSVCWLSKEAWTVDAVASSYEAMCRTPVLLVQARALPRGARCEWQLTWAKEEMVETATSMRTVECTSSINLHPAFYRP